MEYIKKQFRLDQAQYMMSLGYAIVTKSGKLTDCISINDHRHKGFPIKIILLDKDHEIIEYFSIDGKSRSGVEELIFIKGNDKVDKSTLKVMQYVLVRNSTEHPWTIDLYTGSYTQMNGLNPLYDGEKVDQYVCLGGIYKYCIPYKGNEKLFKAY